MSIPIIYAVAFPPMRYTAVVFALEHPIMARWHNVINLVIWFGCRRYRTIHFIRIVQTICVTICELNENILFQLVQHEFN